jgi:hypothetical protein
MKKHVILVVVLLCFTVSVFAADNDGKQFMLTTKADVSACLFSVYAMPAVSLVWQPKLFGLGVEARYLASLDDLGSYFVAMGLVKLGWFYAGFGVDMLTAFPNSSSMEPTVAMSLGLDAPLIQLGPGKLGVNASLDLTPTIEIYESDDALAAIFMTIMEIVYGMVKVSGGVTYSIPF